MKMPLQVLHLFNQKTVFLWAVELDRDGSKDFRAEFLIAVAT